MKQEVKALTKFVRISPRKARLAADLVRGMDVTDACTQLSLCGSKAGRLLLKTLKSAIQNAEENHGMGRDDLIVSEVRIDQGPTMKRAKSKCRGGRVPVLKRSSHFTVVLEQV